MKRDVYRTSVLLFLATVFTAGLTFATLELPYLLDGFLQRTVATPGLDSHVDEVSRLKTELFMAHYHVRAIGYGAFFLLLALIVVGFGTKRTGFAVLASALGVFAIIAMLLAAIGLYGLLAYQVARRRHEIGVRMVMGAASVDVFGLVLRRGLGFVAVGLVAGLGALAVLALASPVPEIPARASDPTVTLPLTMDPMVLVAAVVFLVLVATTACLQPARRALGIDPATVLRSE